MIDRLNIIPMDHKIITYLTWIFVNSLCLLNVLLTAKLQLLLSAESKQAINIIAPSK